MWSVLIQKSPEEGLWSQKKVSVLISLISDTLSIDNLEIADFWNLESWWSLLPSLRGLALYCSIGGIGPSPAGEYLPDKLKSIANDPFDQAAFEKIEKNFLKSDNFQKKFGEEAVSVGGAVSIGKITEGKIGKLENVSC